MEKTIIGRNEPVTFPKLGLSKIPAKIDTGAYRSAIHADNIRVETKDGKATLHCMLLVGHPTADGNSVPFSTSKFNTVGVRSSSAHREDRYEVKLTIELGGQRFVTPFTITKRTEMIFPILIGRKAMRRFLVDTSKTGLDRKTIKAIYGDSGADEEGDEE